MAKFLVFVDSASPYEVDAEGAIDATIVAMTRHPGADRVEVKPADPRYLRQLAARAKAPVLTDVIDVSDPWPEMPAPHFKRRRGRYWLLG